MHQAELYYYYFIIVSLSLVMGRVLYSLITPPFTVIHVTPRRYKESSSELSYLGGVFFLTFLHTLTFVDHHEDNQTVSHVEFSLYHCENT